MYNITLCIPLYNRGKDFKLLLENVNDMYDYFKKNDIILSINVGDFNSTDIDLNNEIKKYKFKTNIYSLDGMFNICKSLQCCADNITDLNTILLFTDADVCITENSYNKIIYYIENILKKNINFIDTMTAIENGNNEIIPTLKEHNGGGILFIYNDDFKRTNGFKDSDFIKERGNYWGGHDAYYQSLFINFGLIMYRPITNTIYLRYHSRNKDNIWYSNHNYAYYSGPVRWTDNHKVIKSIDKNIDIYYFEK